MYGRMDERMNVWECVCVQVRKTIQLQWLCTGRNTPDSSSHVFIDRRVVTFRIMIYEYYPTHLFSLSRQIKRTEQKTKQNKKHFISGYRCICQNTKSQNWRMNEWNSAFSSTYIYKLYHPCTQSVSVCALIYFWLCILYRASHCIPIRIHISFSHCIFMKGKHHNDHKIRRWVRSVACIYTNIYKISLESTESYFLTFHSYLSFSLPWY